jgi:DNA topoisomerase-1
MYKNLLIVESPAKARTIQKYLGSDFKIMASVGHVKDLPVKRLGVDLEKNFEPEYVTIRGKGKVLKDLKSAGRKAEKIYLGPDPDREGEAIAWHIAQELKNGEGSIYRVLFNELTAKAIREAIASPQHLDQDKFESQQARRILDRLVGYRISPLLWRKVKRGLSAGRVQSVALRMICDREREIQAFEAQEYWSLTAHLEAQEPPVFKARLLRYAGKKINLRNESQTLRIMEETEENPFRVTKVSKKRKRKNTGPPFITSLLQQDAYKKLGFSAKRTMSIAQSLYEGVELGDRGETGLITYMRTDSFRISNEAVAQARGYVEKVFGKQYLPAKPNHFKSSKQAQEAHEAIRPTSVELEPESISAFLTKDQKALYTLIWKRFIASQMKAAVLEQTQAEISAGRAIFMASGSVTVFKGFTLLYEEGPNNSDEGQNRENRLPPLNEGLELKLHKLEPKQHFTQPPPRYSEATLIKALEQNGIGRPSTYASILANISQREYVSLEKKRFKPTELGLLVTDLLVQSFPDIMNYAFTAQMENDLDRIERGELDWLQLLGVFEQSFSQELEKAHKEMKGAIITDQMCPECKRPTAIKSGRNGVFLACTGYPECKHTSNFSRDDKGRIVPDKDPEAGKEVGACEICGRPMVVKKGKYGAFVACTGYPECKHTRTLQEPGGENFEARAEGTPCSVCGARMAVKMNRSGQRFLACENYPQCTHTEPLSTQISCPNEQCSGMLVERNSKKGRKFYACNAYPKCRFAMWDEPVDETCPQCGSRVMGVKRKDNAEPLLSCRKKGCGFTKPWTSN